MLIFGLGGGISFYEGLHHMLRPPPLKDAFWNYAVLAAAFCFEGTSFLFALRQFVQHHQRGPLLRALHLSKDPTVYTVLAEDAAALVGLLIAALGIYLSHRLERPWIDGVASMLIGVLLAATAVLLIREARGLLIGEGIRPETLRWILEQTQALNSIVSVGDIRSMYVGPEELLITLQVSFAPQVSAAHAARTLATLQTDIRRRIPAKARIYVALSEPAAGASGRPVRQPSGADQD